MRLRRSPQANRAWPRYGSENPFAANERASSASGATRLCASRYLEGEYGRRRAPARHRKFAGAVAGDAQERGEVVGEDARQRRQVARQNKGAAGVDGQSIGRFAAKADVYLAELSAALREGSYRPQAVKRVEIPKGDGKTRPLGIPTVKDRIVQQAVRLVIEPIFEAGFRDESYGFRPGRGCHDALREVDS